MVIPNGDDGEALMHRLKILVCPILCIPFSAVVQRGEYETFGRCTTNGGFATGLVDVVA